MSSVNESSSLLSDRINIFSITINTQYIKLVQNYEFQSQRVYLYCIIWVMLFKKLLTLEKSEIKSYFYFLLIPYVIFALIYQILYDRFI